MNRPPRSVVIVLTLVLAAGLQLSSAAAADDGFVDIFNGKDLSHWIVDGGKTFKDKGVEQPVWSVRDGMILCTGKNFGFLRYEKPLKDFAVHVEYRLSKGGNSGLGIRTVPFTGRVATRPSFASYEVQLLDDAGKTPDKYTSGALYRYVAPQVNATKPAGQWNSIDVECRGPNIRITLNGKLLHDVDQTTIKEIKDKPLSGYFCLQSHTRQVEFRAVRLKEF